MANWNLPTITSGYLDFVTQMNDKFVDAATLLFGSPTNIPNNSIRYNRTTNIFEEWDLTTWNPKVIGILGGGTGSNTAAGARTNLGLGSMATQNSNAVNITGGTISGVALDAGAINTGIVALARGGTGASLSLGAVGSVFLSNGSQVVFDNGSGISKLNASALSSGTVPDARLSTNVALLSGTNQWGGFNNFVGGINTSTFSITYGLAIAQMISSNNGVNLKRMQLMNYLGNFIIQFQNDDGSFKDNPLSIGPDSIITGIGTGLTNLNAAALSTGIVPTARLGSGAANSGTFLRGDNVWAPATGGSGAVFPSGMISAFDVACPSGWTRYAGLDGRFPLGSTVAGQVGGSTQHNHHLNIWSDSRGAHGHSFSGSVSGTTTDAGGAYNPLNPSGPATGTTRQHTHDYNANFSGSTGGVGDHNHNTDGYTDNVDQYPPWYSVVYCRKD